MPARIAGCPVRVLCTPPGRDGRADPAVLVAAQLCGVDEVFKVGGAQAIAAMAYGTESIPKVDKIFGPGNAWVTAAKQLVAADPDGAALDLPAGPSEVLVIADESARAGVRRRRPARAGRTRQPLAQAILVTTSRALAAAVQAEVDRQLAAVARDVLAGSRWQQSRVIVVDDLATAIDVSNLYAPEHLILQVREPRRWLPRVSNAGSVFLGSWTPEPMGDYCSGTNHVLPTYGHARAYSGLSVLDFVKRITVQETHAGRPADLGPTAATLAGSKASMRMPTPSRSTRRAGAAAQEAWRVMNDRSCRWRGPTSSRWSPTSMPPGIRVSSACTPTKCRGAPSGDNSIAGLNRYPEPQPQALVERLAQLYGVDRTSCWSAAAATRPSTCWCVRSAARARTPC